MIQMMKSNFSPIKLNKFILFQLIKIKLNRALAKKSHRLLGIRRTCLPAVSKIKIPELIKKNDMLLYNLELITLFTLHKKTTNSISRINIYLIMELHSSLKKRALKKVRRTRRRLFHKRLKKFKNLLCSYYH
jgi:hypothetical protein